LPGVPMTVVGPITSVGLARSVAAALLLSVSELPDGNSRLPLAMLARLTVCAPVTKLPTAMLVTALSVTPGEEVTVNPGELLPKDSSWAWTLAEMLTGLAPPANKALAVGAFGKVPVFQLPPVSQLPLPAAPVQVCA